MTSLGDDRFALKPGDRFGGSSGDRFLVEAKAGLGGQAVVFRVLDTRLSRKAAVKVSTAGGRDRRAFQERFERELQLTARINHPHVLQVYDCGELPEGEPWVLLEWMERGSLADLVDRAKKAGMLLPLDYVHYYAVSIAAALRAVHKTQMIHRDMKPDNVLIAGDGVAKITDFGIAKDISPEATPLTEVGQTLGTLGFMAPEQLSGLPGPQSDVFSYGVTLYAVITGKMPEQVSQNAIPLGRIQDVAWERVPAAFVPVLQKLTAFELDERCQDFDEVLRLLRDMELPPDSRPRLMAPGSLPPLPAGAFVTTPGGAGAATFEPLNETLSSGFGETTDLDQGVIDDGVKAGSDSVDSRAATADAEAVPVTRMQAAIEDESVGHTRAFPAGSPRPDAIKASPSKLPLAIAALAILGAVIVAGVKLTGSSDLPAPDVVLGTVRTVDAAAARGDWKAAQSAMTALPKGVAETDGGKLLLGLDSLLQGKAGDARSHVASLTGGSGELAARSNLVLGAAARLSGAAGYGEAANAYSAATGCDVPACADVRDRARRGLAEACAVTGSGEACGGSPPPTDERDRHLLASLVLLGDGHESAATARLAQALKASGDGASCFEASALQRWAGSGVVPPALKGSLAEAGQAAARSEDACQSFGRLAP